MTPPTSDEVRVLCSRARAAGMPAAAARSTLLKDYLRLALALGVPAREIETGHDLVRASAALLRVPAPPVRSRI